MHYIDKILMTKNRDLDGNCGWIVPIITPNIVTHNCRIVLFVFSVHYFGS